MTVPLTDAFEAQRGRLRAVAYRVLGSHADAGDVVQEAWLRLSHQDPGTIDNLAGWLTTVVGRLSLDLLRSRQAHPETAYGQDVAHLVVTPDDTPAPDEQAERADSVGRALLVVLDSLTPNERLALVLHDMFAVPFRDIGQILGKSADASKMIASRARRKAQAKDRPARDARTARSSGPSAPPPSAATSRRCSVSSTRMCGWPWTPPTAWSSPSAPPKSPPAPAGSPAPPSATARCWSTAPSATCPGAPTEPRSPPSPSLFQGAGSPRSISSSTRPNSP